MCHAIKHIQDFFGEHVAKKKYTGTSYAVVFLLGGPDYPNKKRILPKFSLFMANSAGKKAFYRALEMYVKEYCTHAFLPLTL
jgi:hypothetical protein